MDVRTETLYDIGYIFYTMSELSPAIQRRLHKKICFRCNARNPIKTDNCRKCGYGNLRMKAKEPRAN